MRIAVVYHGIDLDGWMSAAIVKRWFQTSNETLPEMMNMGTKDFPVWSYNKSTLSMFAYNYGQQIPDLSSYDKVIMCDISLPEVIMEQISLDSELIWIDHHISAIQSANFKTHHYRYSSCRGLRDTKFAACELTWKYFFPNEEMPEIVRLLGRYDCFGHKGTKEEQKVLEFQYASRAKITNYEEAYNWLIQWTNIHTQSWIQTGKDLYKYLCTEAQQSYKNGFPITLGLITDRQGPDSYEVVNTDTGETTISNSIIENYKFICINKERFNPINFGIDYHKDLYDGAACFHYANGKWNFSLYNDNGLVDCSVIAKQFGGGGHKGAAGFVCDDETLLKLLGNNAR